SPSPTQNSTLSLHDALPISSKEAQIAGAAPEFGDIEPYPSIPVPVLIEWVKALEAHGFKPAFLHLDINVHYLDVHPEIPLAADRSEEHTSELQSRSDLVCRL